MKNKKNINLQKSQKDKPDRSNINVVINNAGVIISQPITETLEKNYMPYAMSVIVSRAIPEIDGFKPAHRKLLFTMYKMGLLNGARTKSANVVGQTMRLNPHGDSSIYETLVRLSKGYNILLHPYVDSKGNFGKSYSRDMAYAASRYTEVKLADISKELFLEIDKNTVEFVDNYDNTMKEPSLLPVNFPSILVNSNIGIAVGMASSISSFNLKEVCETTIGLIKNPDHDILKTLKAPDFPTGGLLLYNSSEIHNIYETGKGSFKIRSKYKYDKANNCLEIFEIPPSTTIEVIIEKVIELIKMGRIKEISDIRDETDLNGLKIAIDLKRSVDPKKLIKKLFKFTTLEDSFSCNFNILIDGHPKVLGIKQILNEWISFRIKCVKNRINFDINKKKNSLHLFYGLKKILLDIDKAINIIKESKLESDVIPNLMSGFDIDKIQAEYISEIKLKNLNNEYLLNKIKEIDILESEINLMEKILSEESKIKNLIVNELSQIAKKYGQPRKTEIVNNFEVVEDEPIEIENYPVNFFLTKEGYFKKITPLSLRMGSEHKLKQNDEISQLILGNNIDDLLFFTDHFQVYKAKANDFKDTKASLIGDFLPVKLGINKDENVLYMANTNQYLGYMLFFFENGKVAKITMKSYETKTNRKKLISAYYDKSKLISMIYIKNDCHFLIKSKNSRCLIFDSSLINPKQLKDSQGVIVIKLKKGDLVISVNKIEELNLEDPLKNKMLIKEIPSAGILIKNDIQQLSLL